MSRVLRPFSIFVNSSKLAIILVNGRKSALPELWKKFWNDSPLRGCTDGAADKIRQECCDGVLKWPTILSGDFDSISEGTRRLFENFSEVIETPDQEKTDLTKCLEIVLHKDKSEIEALLILGGFSGRFDHTIASVNTLLIANSLTSLPIYALDGENLITVLPSGTSEINIDVSKTTKICGIIPFCQKETRVTLDGFQWNLEDAELNFGGLISTSNRIVSDRLVVTTSAPVIFTIELIGMD